MIIMKNAYSKKLMFLSLFLLSASLAFAQNKSEILPLSSFFPKPVKVLFVGTFHFHYPGLDAHVIADSNKVDVLSESRKKEVTELVNYIKRFKPTKIAIEAFPKWEPTEKLRDYKKGAYRMERDERYQLGLRIADELNLDTIYAIDDVPLVSDPGKLDPVYVKNLFKDYDYKSDDPYSKIYEEWYAYDDKLRLRLNLLDYFKHTNSRSYHQAGHGAYLIGDFKLNHKRGADALAMNWYSRNLRIFRNLQGITESSKDRILVIFGNGHGSILRQLLESSPEYEFVEFDKLK
ncbi:DUF5694 domain-containing protein [Mucilaginibacter galii]